MTGLACPDCADHQRTVITDPTRIRAINMARNLEEAPNA